MIAEDFKAELIARFHRAAERHADHVDVTSGDLHRAIGGYPGSGHRMPSCCDVMYNEMQAHDEILSAPPSGKGATLTIRYRLPR